MYHFKLILQQKTVQHFPPLSTQSSTPSSSAYETSSVKQLQLQQVQQHHAVSAYRPRTKQSKINLTPFTPSNSVPGNFVPIVYTAVNNNNNNNNNNHVVITSHDATKPVLDSINTSDNVQQEIGAIEYSDSLPISIDNASQYHRSAPLKPQQQLNNHHPHQHQHLHNLPPKQQGQYYSVTPSSSSLQSAGDPIGSGGVSSQHPNPHQGVG